MTQGTTIHPDGGGGDSNNSNKKLPSDLPILSLTLSEIDALALLCFEYQVWGMAAEIRGMLLPKPGFFQHQNRFIKIAEFGVDAIKALTSDDE